MEYDEKTYVRCARCGKTSMINGPPPKQWTCPVSDCHGKSYKTVMTTLNSPGLTTLVTCLKCGKKDIAISPAIRCRFCRSKQLVQTNEY